MTRCFAMAVLLSSVLSATADPLDQWHWRAPLPQGYSLHGVAVTAGLRVVVGELGVIMVCTNGVEWVLTTAPVVTNLNEVCFTGERFVAVGDGGTILTSTTGVAWTSQSSPTTNHLYSVTTADGLIVAVGERGTIATSPNGISWTQRISHLDGSARLRDIAFGDGRFVTVGWAIHEDYSYSVSCVSPDGINWQTLGGFFPIGAGFGGVTFGNGQFLATTGSHFAISSDGLEWFFYYLGAATNASGVTFWDGRFIAASGLGIIHSSDGTNWTVAATTSGPFRNIDVADGHGVAVGRIGRLASSSNLTDWRMISSGPDGYMRGLTFGKDRFVGVIGPTIFTSVGGKVWTRQTVGPASPLPNTSLNSVAYGKGLFIAVGGIYLSMTNLISTDGYSWVSLNIPTSNALAGIAFINDRFVAVGEAGTICESMDGTNWTIRTIPDMPNLQAVTYGNGRYVAAGVGAIYTSANLEEWTVTGGTNVNFYALAFGNGMFVAGGVVQSGKAGQPTLRSFDGLSWEPASTYPSSMRAVAFGRGTFVAAANAGIVSSTNGLDWVRRNSLLFPTAQTVAFGLETFVVNRFEGGIVQSDEMVPLPRLGLPAYVQGHFELSLLTGTPGFTYVLESSGDLNAWSHEMTVVPLQFPFGITNQSAGPSRFYRVVGD